MRTIEQAQTYALGDRGCLTEHGSKSETLKRDRGASHKHRFSAPAQVAQAQVVPSAPATSCVRVRAYILSFDKNERERGRSCARRVREIEREFPDCAQAPMVVTCPPGASGGYAIQVTNPQTGAVMQISQRPRNEARLESISAPSRRRRKKIRFRVVREKEGSCTCQASDGAGGAAGGAAVPSAISGGAISTAARHGHAGAAVPATAVRARLPGRAAGGAGELAQVQRLRRTLRPRSGRQPFYIASIPMRAPAFGPNVRVNWQGVLVWKFERVGVRLGGSFLNTLRRGQIWNLETRATRVSITTRANRRSPSDVDPAHLSSR